jgi:hypothetical protein
LRKSGQRWEGEGEGGRNKTKLARQVVGMSLALGSGTSGWVVIAGL